MSPHNSSTRSSSAATPPLTRRTLRASAFSTLALITLIATTPARAGTPLICHPYAIGAAASLPGSNGDWKGVNPSYDRTHLVRDTLALLTGETPVIVRMETLRRAAIYATAGLRGWSTTTGYTAEDRAHVAALLEKLRARAQPATGPASALALFDYGFFCETLRHTNIDPALDGYPLLTQALALRGGSDAEMEFALAWPVRGRAAATPTRITSPAPALPPIPAHSSRPISPPISANPNASHRSLSFSYSSSHRRALPPGGFLCASVRPLIAAIDLR